MSLVKGLNHKLTYAFLAAALVFTAVQFGGGRALAADFLARSTRSAIRPRATKSSFLIASLTVP